MIQTAIISALMASFILSQAPATSAQLDSSYGNISCDVEARNKCER